MVCLGLEPGEAGWKTQTNALSYGGYTFSNIFCRKETVDLSGNRTQVVRVYYPIKYLK